MIWLDDARPEDAAVLARIMGDWIMSTDWMPKLHSAEEDQEFLSDLIATQTVRVARDGAGTALGFLARRGGEVDALYIGSSSRGRGIGTALIEEAKAGGWLELWTFQANAGAIAFYLRQGFVEIERTDGSRNDEHLPDLSLRWEALP